MTRARPRLASALLWSCVFIALLSRVSFIAVPFWSDSGIYIYMGKVVATGGRLYHDIYEIKFPGVALICAPLWQLFGSFWPPYVLTQTAMAFGAATLLGAAMSRHVGEHAGRATLLYALLLINFTPAVFTGFQLETIQLFFGCIAAWFAMRSIARGGKWDAVGVGLAAGMAAVVKPSGLAVLGAYALTMLVFRREMMRTIIAALAAMLPIGLVIAWTAHAGLLDEMPALAREISLYASETPLVLGDLAKVAVVVVVIGFPMLIRWRCPCDPDTRYATPDTRPLLLFALLWFALEAVGVMMQRRMLMYHFLVLTAPGALGFGLIPRPARTPNLAVALTPIAIVMICWSAPLLTKLNDGWNKSALTQYLAAHTPARSAIFCDWMPRILLESDLRPGARYPNLRLLGNYDYAPLQYADTMLADFEQRKPKYIVLPADFDAYLNNELDEPCYAQRPQRSRNLLIAWERINRYVRQHYEPETQIKSWHVLRRKETR